MGKYEKEKRRIRQGRKTEKERRKWNEIQERTNFKERKEKTKQTWRTQQRKNKEETEMKRNPRKKDLKGRKLRGHKKRWNGINKRT